MLLVYDTATMKHPESHYEISLSSMGLHNKHVDVTAYVLQIKTFPACVCEYKFANFIIIKVIRTTLSLGSYM